MIVTVQAPLFLLHGGVAAFLAPCYDIKLRSPE